MTDTETGGIWLPPNDHWLIKGARFLNVLDDAKNVLSPVKMNLWAANMTAVSAGAATVLAWIGGHMGVAAELWGPIGGWLTQAHATHHFDKRERNLQTARMKDQP